MHKTWRVEVLKEKPYLWFAVCSNSIDSTFLNMKHFILFLALFFANHVFSQSKSAIKVLNSVDRYLNKTPNTYYQAGFCFKSAPKTDTSSRDAAVMLFDKGTYPNDTLKSFIIKYPDGKSIQAFDGRYFYVVNHIIKTIKTTDVGATGIRKAMEGWASDFVFPPFLRKKERHFLPNIYSESTVLKPSGNPAFSLLENVDSTKNDPKISSFDPDYVTITTQFHVFSKTGAPRMIRRWVYFMATPQYEEFYYSDFMSLPDTSTFKSYFDLEKYIQLDYQDYDQYKEKQGSTPPALAAQKGDIFPTFTLPDIQGATWHSDSLKSGLILLDFWYRSCYPCLKAMPVMESLHQKYGAQGLLVLGVNAKDPSASELKTFLKSRKVRYNSLMDEKSAFAKRLSITGFPTLFLIDAATKKVLFAQGGYSDQTEAELEALIKTQLGLK